MAEWLVTEGTVSLEECKVWSKRPTAGASKGAAGTAKAPVAGAGFLFIAKACLDLGSLS